MGAYWLLGLAAALALGLGGAPAAAQPLPQGGMTANEIAAWLKRSGAPADVKPDTTTPSPPSPMGSTSTSTSISAPATAMSAAASRSSTPPAGRRAPT
jgi:hypothetical protein